MTPEELRQIADTGFGPGMSHRLLDEIDRLTAALDAADAVVDYYDDPDNEDAGQELVEKALAHRARTGGTS